MTYQDADNGFQEEPNTLLLSTKVSQPILAVIERLPPPNMIDLPRCEPSIAQLTDVRGSEFLPWTFYNITGVSDQKFQHFVKTIDDNNIIGSEPNAIHLVRSAPISSYSEHPRTLHDALDAHMRYCTTHLDELDFFPFGFLAAHDEVWDENGVFLVYIDFEEPFEVTGFCLSTDDVPAAASTLRDDDNGIREVRDMYERPRGSSLDAKR
jgi:hypothetical protein